MQGDKSTPSYYVVVPATVNTDNRLQFGARLLYGNILTLSNKSGECWATDSYFTGLYAVSKQTIQRWITELEKYGYIERKVHKDNLKTIRTLKPLVSVAAREGNIHVNVEGNAHVNVEGNADSTHEGNVKVTQNNTSINNIAEQVVSYLNDKTGKNYKATTKATKTLIHARQAEGYKLEDFQTVIDTKCQQWRNDSKMQTYLRPATLFAGSKFESYLNEQPRPKAKPTTSPIFDKDKWIAEAYQDTGSLEGVMQAIQEAGLPITEDNAKTAVRALQRNLGRVAK